MAHAPDSGRRQVSKIKRGIMTLADDLTTIRRMGAAALSDTTKVSMFMGMYLTVQTTFDRLREEWERAIDTSEDFKLDPSFPTAEEKAILLSARKDYYECHSYYLQLKPPPQRSSADATLNSSTMIQAAPTARTILPKIQIKRFSGNWTEWPSFKQLFSSLIKEEESLTDAERFQYLVSYLDGSALGVIKHIPVTDVNFKQAWSALVRVYDDKRKMASSYLERLLSFKMASSEPTAESLQSYLSQVSESISSLKNLKIPDMEDYLLCELALRALDHKTRQAFEIANIGTTFPKFETLKEFVQNRYHVLRITDSSNFKVAISKPTQANKAPQHPNRFSNRAHALLVHSSKQDSSKTQSKSQDSTQFSCFICQQRHVIVTCPQFLSMDPPQRLAALKLFSGCRNCLHPAHRTRDCPSTFVCKECEGRHHTMLHLLPKSGQSQNDRLVERSNTSNESGFAGTSVSPNNACVLLGTVIASIQDAKGNVHRFRGLLDAGSQHTIVTTNCASKLNMILRPYHGSISGVNNSPLHNIKGKVSLSFNLCHPNTTLQTEAIVVPSITPPLPQIPLHSSIWDDYRSYQLSDPGFTEPGPISFLIGADLYPEVVIGAPIVIHEDGPRLIETVFGYTVVGRFFGKGNRPTVSLLSYSNTEALIEKFWVLEEPSQPTVQSPEEERCERHFIKTHSRTDEGRYVVSLPFKSNDPSVTLNTNQALTRLYSLESKLAKDTDLRQDYINFMKEYKDLGHMSVATDPPKYVIPHHPVYRVMGKERKIRVVFDASCRSLGGSLNDHLLIGPKLQADICNIVLDFRRYRYVFTCDIVKMFRQIEVAEQDRCYQQIVWRDDPSKPVTFYQLNTVTYGTRSAPYLAQRVVKQLAQDEGNIYPNAARALLHNVYVDDIAVGRDSEHDLVQLRHELVQLLGKGCMELSKWASNLPSLLHDTSCPSQPVDLCADEVSSTKILGMNWCPYSDALSYDVSAPTPGFTKRIILSTIARLYDPLGYLAPAVFYAKCIMQETWKSNIGWDDVVSKDIKNLWEQYISELHLLSTISIPRHLPTTDTTYQLLCFSDASEKGYCGVVYVRAIHESTASLSLIKAKTRLAPLKTLTIPRLELCGALLLAELIRSLEPLKRELGISEIFCFTDSMIVLAWLRTMPHLLQTFVSNRVQQILQFTHVNQWYHIKGVQNPADVGSRGALPSALRYHPLWWSGPEWAHDPIDKWPLTDPSHDSLEIEVPELRPNKLALVTVDTCQDFIKYSERHSSWLKLIRVIAYIKRFISNSQLRRSFKHSRLAGPLTPTEITTSNHHCIKLIQHAYFPDAFTCNSPETLPLELRRLAVFVDNHGLIRVGGRLSKAPIPMEQKHPLLLPARCHFSLIIVRHLHAANHHAGPTMLLATLRLNYWIPRARNLVKLVKQRCVTCTRFSKATIMPFMGDLPLSRFAGVRPFLISGVDFAGPFLCKETSRRKASAHKCYLSIFVCMSSRAYHLELVTALTVEAFLDALSRFTARRGIPARMMSDCGTNFTGTVNYLRELREWFNSQETETSLINCTNHLGIQWSFNPPAAPHFGGGWEVGVKAVKNLLFKTVGNHPFTQDELTTLFVKIEGVLNSRPLQPISESPDDPEVLTPGHFLIGQPLNALPEVDLQDVPTNRLSRWQLIRERVQHFWTRWSREYLSTLQIRNKWLNHPLNLKVGDLVFISDANAPPSCWLMGRVLTCHPGEDGIVRVVTLKTQKGILKRPSVKLVLLHTDEQ